MSKSETTAGKKQNERRLASARLNDQEFVLVLMRLDPSRTWSRKEAIEEGQKSFNRVTNLSAAFTNLQRRGFIEAVEKAKYRLTKAGVEAAPFKITNAGIQAAPVPRVPGASTPKNATRQQKGRKP